MCAATQWVTTPFDTAWQDLLSRTLERQSNCRTQRRAIGIVGAAIGLSAVIGPEQIDRPLHASVQLSVIAQRRRIESLNNASLMLIPTHMNAKATRAVFVSSTAGRRSARSAILSVPVI